MWLPFVGTSVAQVSTSEPRMNLLDRGLAKCDEIRDAEGNVRTEPFLQACEVRTFAVSTFRRLVVPLVAHLHFINLLAPAHRASPQRICLVCGKQKTRALQPIARGRAFVDSMLFAGVAPISGCGTSSGVTDTVSILNRWTQMILTKAD